MTRSSTYNIYTDPDNPEPPPIHRAIAQPVAQNLVADLRRLVEAESKTNDIAALRRCAAVIVEIGSRLLGGAGSLTVTDTGGGPVVQWRFGPPPWRLALVGHFDTVHPIGVLQQQPFSQDKDTVRGPGVHDMKAGLITVLHACASVLATNTHGLDGAMIHFSPDEEDGSRWSKPLLSESVDDGLRLAIVFEGVEHSTAVFVSRKSGLWVDIILDGVSAHGSRPELGSNPIQAAFHLGRNLQDIEDIEAGTTVTPTRINCSGTFNTIPDRTTLTLDCRTITSEEQDRVLHVLGRHTPILGVRQCIRVLHKFPPMSRASTSRVFTLLRAVSAREQMPPLQGTVGSGISDACHLAELGVHVLDGMGPAGGGDHTQEEWASLASIGDRIRLTAAAVEPLRCLAKQTDTRTVAGIDHELTRWSDSFNQSKDQRIDDIRQSAAAGGDTRLLIEERGERQ